jgi:hypothetical protein
MTLGDLTNVELSKYSCDQNGCTDRTVRWNGSHFERIGHRDQQTGQIVYDQTPTTLTDPAFQQWEGAWCEPLKAYLRLGGLYYAQNGTQTNTPTNASTVYYDTQATVTPTEAAALQGVPLYTWSFTLGTYGQPISQSDVTNANTAQSSYWGHEVEKTFYFDPDDMMLKDNVGNAASIAGLTIPDGSFMQGGYQFGPLTTTHYYNNQSPYIWEANNAATYYTWSSGSDQWNQYITVRDAGGNLVAFDPPISFTYTHTTANDANSSSAFNEKKFRIEYDGFQVNIPWYFDEQSAQWVPQININDVTLMGPNGDEYVIKGMEQALIMSEVSDPGSLTYSEVGAPELTYDATKTALVGTVPTGVELKVIKGEVIE